MAASKSPGSYDDRLECGEYRRRPRLRDAAGSLVASLCQQHVGWGVVDVLIVAVAARLQARRMTRLPNPYDPLAMQREQRTLRDVLLGNVVADAGYVVTGAVLCSRKDPRASGAGAAIMLQGLFLLLHDAHHAHGSRPG